MSKYVITVTLSCNDSERDALNTALQEAGFGPNNMNIAGGDGTWRTQFYMRPDDVKLIKRVADKVAKADIILDKREGKGSTKIAQQKIKEHFDNVKYKDADKNKRKNAKVDIVKWQ